ncbi:MAG: PEP-CTERM sorting domain-containing protein [Verrucomicrobiales bacterium]
MKFSISRFVFAVLGFSLSASGVSAATVFVDAADAAAIPGVNTFKYDNYFVLNPGEGAQWASDTDAYSWDHPNLASDDPTLGAQTGWVHLSRWVAVTLAQPVNLTIRIDQAAGVEIPDQNNPGEMIGAGADLVPAFTLWSGLEANAEDGSLGLANPNGGHRFDNDGNQTSWIDDMVYVAHDGNAGNAPFVEMTLVLDAGSYTFNIAGSKEGAFVPGVVPGDLRKGYTATLTASAVPEPSSALLVTLAAAGFVVRRSRSRKV